MGILNVTPDSFSDGSRFDTVDTAMARAHEIAAEGAAIIDVGGESTRPGASPVGIQEEIDRVVPVIEKIAAAVDIAVSVDTRKLSVMRAAVKAGACIVNDVNALRSDGAREWAAAQGVGVCLMHMRGEPRTMQSDPHYVDVVAEVAEFLSGERAACIDAGIAADAIVLDPGIGFGKRHEHNMTLLKKLKRLTTLGSPLLIGVSRKSLIGKVLGVEFDQRLYGGLGLAALAVSMGAKIIRTHDVAATREAVTMVGAVLS